MLWLRRWLAKSVSPSKTKRPSIRPRLEILEDRQLPAVNPLLATPTLIAPSGIAPPQPTFSWGAVSGAAQYNFWLADDTKQQVVASGTLAGTTSTPSTALTSGDSYEWAVQAVDGNGNTSQWSASLHFTDSNLTAPTLLAPSGATTTLPTFTWNAVAGAAKYTLTLTDQTTQQVQQITGLTTATWTPTTPLINDNTYQWSVQAVNSSGTPGPSSSALTFAVSSLAAPALLGPTGPATPLPIFTWNAVTGADHYDIWVQNQGTNQVLRDTNVAGTTWTPSTPLAQGASYTWWVRAIDSSSYKGPWSSSLSFSEAVLAPPTLLGPSGTDLPLPTFSWNLVPGADHYDIWLQDVKTGQVIRNTNVGGTTWTPASPLFQQDSYIWWVRAVDPYNNNGQWSNSLTFVVQELAPPTLIGPAGSSITLPTFSWNDVTGANQYDIWVQDMNTAQVLRNQSVPGTTWTPASPLHQGDKYTWWVRAIDNVNSPGPWSAGVSFTVAALAAPNLIAPAGSSITLPTFSWNAVTGASQYDIWVQDRNTGQILRNQLVPGIIWTPSSPLIQGDKYDWWVRAIDSVNSPGPWSGAKVFTVAALGVPVLSGPSGAIITPLPTFTWNTITGADHYDIWLQDNRTGQIIRDENVFGATWSSAVPLTIEESYTWWVRAIDSVNSPGQWSTAQTFTIYALPAPTLIAPAGSASGLPTFSWNAVTGASHYDIWVQDIRTGVVLRNTNVIGTTWIPSNTLKKGDSYIWWVRAIDSNDLAGVWSASLTLAVVS